MGQSQAEQAHPLLNGDDRTIEPLGKASDIFCWPVLAQLALVLNSPQTFCETSVLDSHALQPFAKNTRPEYNRAGE